MDLIEFNKEISFDTLELMKVDYINDSYIKNDEIYNKIIKNTIINLEKNKEDINLDINQIRNEIKMEKQPNIPLLLLLSSLI